MGLAGKVVLVTGGVGGIAMATNEALIGRGARVALLYPAVDAAKVPQALIDLGAEHAAAFPPGDSRYPGSGTNNYVDMWRRREVYR